MGQSPLFSVIIPAYNEEKTIAATLRSIIRQNFPPNQYEVILVNNNSTDRTKEIAQKFPIKIVDEKRQGYVHALRKGCQEAKGKILVFTDADTIVPANWLKKYQEAYRNPRVVCAGGGGKLEPKVFISPIIEKSLFLVGITLKIFSGFNFSIRRTTYQKIGGFNPQINFNTDTDLILRAKKEGKVVFLKKNNVITSSRRYRDISAFPYMLKGILNSLSLLLFKKTIFFEFGNVRNIGSNPKSTQ